MQFQDQKIRNTVLSFDFLVGTFFLVLLISFFSLEESNLPTIKFLMGLFLIFILGGFFMYIYTPALVSLSKTFLVRREYYILPPISVSILFIFTKLIFSVSIDVYLLFFQCIIAIIFICTPTLLYLIIHASYEEGLTWVDIIGGLWIWLPIEAGIADEFIGSIDLGEIPLEMLLGIFAFLYALIFVRGHEMGLTFTLSYNDILVTNKINIYLILAIIPLGMVTYFLAPPNVIWSNFIDIIEKLPGSIVDIFLTFLLIFLAIALIEEMFFRGFIFNLLSSRFELSTKSEIWWYGGVFLMVILISITPWLDNFFDIISQQFTILAPLYDITKSMAKPLGETEGQMWPIVGKIPLEILYIGVALLLGLIALIIIHHTQEPMIAALVISSILFGWAHFEDVRYTFFASIAGFAYGWTYYKTGKIVPAALVHMTVDAVWSLLLSF